MASPLPPPSPGGFMLSPPASSTISSTTSGRPTLPHPRESPLRPGGSKESAFIRYADQQMLHIQRRFAKRTSPSTKYLSDMDRDKADTWGDVKGYGTMQEACKEIGELVDLIWISGSPKIQLPYLISIALLLETVIQGMPPSPRGLFKLLNKMDHAFASLMQGRDAQTGERLPGLINGQEVTGTEKVRIRSIIERTRVDVVESFKKGEFEEERVQEIDEDKMDTDTDGELVLEGPDWDEPDEDDDTFDMSIAKVYDRTMVELGESLEEASLGIITEGRSRT